MAEPAADGQVYTRGRPGDPDARGESLVQKHREKVQQEKEDAALDKLASLMPQMGGMVRALALSQTNWDVEAALSMLRQFQVAFLDKLNVVSKKRKRIQEALANEDGGGLDSGSASDEDDDDDSDDDSPAASGSQGDGSESDPEQHRSKKRKGGKSSKHSRKSSRKQEKKEKHKKEKHKKEKHKKEKKKRSRRDEPSASDGSDEEQAQGRTLERTTDYGRFGVLRDSDRGAKHAEFVLWAQDERKVNLELLGQREEKELWGAYMEDYNTGTLPHRRYYDLEAYERRQMAKAASKGGKASKGGERKRTAADDEEELRRLRVAERQKEAEARLKEAYAEMQKTGKAAEMRQQELLRAEMNLAYKTGDKHRAQKLFERLAPDEKK